MTKPFNNADNPPKSLMDIVDEAYEIVDGMIDEMRGSGQLNIEDLKDLRSLLNLAENFREYEEE
jgi:hypothetical protein